MGKPAKNPTVLFDQHGFRVAQNPEKPAEVYHDGADILIIAPVTTARGEPRLIVEKTKRQAYTHWGVYEEYYTPIWDNIYNDALTTAEEAIVIFERITGIRLTSYNVNPFAQSIPIFCGTNVRVSVVAIDINTCKLDKGKISENLEFLTRAKYVEAIKDNRVDLLLFSLYNIATKLIETKTKK